MQSGKKKKITKIVLIIAFVGTLGILSAYYLFSIGYLRLNNPSYAEYPVQGIDVSNHQGVIDWDVLDKEQVQFAFIKSTEGGDFKDKSFATNWKGAKRNGVVRSAYHFFTFCRSGSEQALNFIETVPNEPDMLPPAIDLEYSGNCKMVKSKGELIEDIDTFIKILEAEYQRYVIIYVTEDFYNDYLIGRYPNNPLWVRDVRRKARVKDNRDWMFWQFANRGRVDGIKTLVDLNVFNGSKVDFENFVNRGFNDR